jgi:tRNA(Arg) A34 adenosine deaminase TadA
MCSTAIRQSGISRVAFGATYSPTGGYTSACPVLRDGSIPRFRFAPPEVVPGLLAERAEGLLAELEWPGPTPGP